MHETLKDEQQSSDLLRQQLKTQLLRLDTQESNLIELAAENSSAKRKVRQKLLDIERERDRLQRRLIDVENEITAGAELLEVALGLLERPDELYERATDAGRRAINQALFAKLHVYRDEISSDELRSPFAELVAAHGLMREQQAAVALSCGPQTEARLNDPSTTTTDHRGKPELTC